MLQNSKSVLRTLRSVSRLPKISQPHPTSSVGLNVQLFSNDVQLVRSFHATKLSHKWFEREERKQYAVDTKELKDLVQSDQVFLIDVREDNEVAAGKVPAKRFLHIPLGEFVVSLYLTEEEFKKKYGFSLPTKDSTDVVIMCRRGIRSTFALQMMQDKGFSGVKHYLDGWVGWEEMLSGK